MLTAEEETEALYRCYAFGGLRYLELDVNDLIRRGASRKKAIHYLYKKTFTSRQGLSKRKTIVVWIKNKLRISLS